MSNVKPSPARVPPSPSGISCRVACLRITVPSRSTVTTTSSPGRFEVSWSRSRSGSPFALTPSIASRWSPGFRPAAAAAEPLLTESTAVVARRVGIPIQKIAAKITTASRMFTAGPARIVTTRFQTGMLEYARGSTSGGISSPWVIPVIFT